jgi:hypothetical protein
MSTKTKSTKLIRGLKRKVNKQMPEERRLGGPQEVSRITEGFRRTKLSMVVHIVSNMIAKGQLPWD